MKLWMRIVFYVFVAVTLGPSWAVAIWLAYRLARYIGNRRARRYAARMARAYGTTERPDPVGNVIPFPGGQGFDTVREPISKRTRLLVNARDGWRCRNKACRTRKGPFELDHIFPIALGGTNRMVNLQTLCVPCNRAKGAKLPHPSLIPSGEVYWQTVAD